jgi:hypothetical protein
MELCLQKKIMKIIVIYNTIRVSREKSFISNANNKYMMISNLSAPSIKKYIISLQRQAILAT